LQKDIFSSPVHQPGKIGGIVQDRPATLAGFQVQSENSVRTCAIERVAVDERHRFVALLVIKVDLLGSRLQGFIHEMSGELNPITVGNLASSIG